MENLKSWLAGGAAGLAGLAAALRCPGAACASCPGCAGTAAVLLAALLGRRLLARNRKGRFNNGI
jgi:hypothetical protein